MRIISHRGNLNGPRSSRENHPESIINALHLGFDCEIDVWFIKSEFWLGHDFPEYKIHREFLWNNEKLWIHCKNFEALEELSFDIDLVNNVFYHNVDDYTITSKGVIWAYPGKKVGKNCVIVLQNISEYDFINNAKIIKGVCTDYPLDIQSKYLSSLDDGSLTTHVTASDTA